jgi:Ca2+-transporting ATPase
VVQILLAKNNIVAVTGDGVNDAPALKSANIGIAMGIIGTDVAKEAADMTLTDDNFATIVSAVRKGRNIFENIIKTIFYLLSCNIGEILVIFIWLIIGPSLLPLVTAIIPLLPLQLLWVNLITDSLPAISLAKEPLDLRLMEQPPRRVKEPIFTRRFTINIAIIGVLICIGTLGLFYYGLLKGIHQWGTGDPLIEDQIYRYATSLAFMTVIMFENWNIYCSRSLKHSIFKIKAQNYYMHLAIFIAIILQVITIYIPPLNSVFHTYPLDWVDWILIVAVSSSVVGVTELYKILWKWWDKRATQSLPKS